MVNTRANYECRWPQPFNRLPPFTGKRRDIFSVIELPPEDHGLRPATGQLRAGQRKGSPTDPRSLQTPVPLMIDAKQNRFSARVRCLKTRPQLSRTIDCGSPEEAGGATAWFLQDLERRRKVMPALTERPPELQRVLGPKVCGPCGICSRCFGASKNPTEPFTRA